ncbi:hypothetical protein MKS88_004714 [Plasmodium brasilianum]|uniref:Uncharacterized protein n=2 Tax=Plasmodium (Plasmodium) TaxID=418103 RepID=A0A1A8X536_PLAMA|nr:conserved Plasmodium protein, unknown function [Plasmodium malariae]KAI4836907.1 hypothetical protein MKS88_004714 [Plasmodium brasilianum]SBS99296.1 hypothetical protein PMALA_068990 [Plasmodium malariae]SCO94209.1 conserved Plasmodium protein, unknown function [Plasmodium malariae]
MSDPNSLQSNTLPEFTNQINNLVSTENAQANSKLLFVLATTLLVIYIGLMISVVLPVKQEEESKKKEENSILQKDEEYNGPSQNNDEELEKVPVKCQEENAEENEDSY